MKIKELAQKYDLSKDDFWELKRGTRSMWIITHDACEKIAAKENIQFGAPTIYRDSNKDVAIVGGGNSALEEVDFMLKVANKIYLVNIDDKFNEFI